MRADAKLRIEVDGEVQFSRWARGLIRRLTSWKPFFERFAPRFIDLLRRRMDSEGAADGQAKWPELSEQYAAWKQQHFPGKPMLQRTGDLYEAVTKPEVEITDETLTITIDSPYAIYHHSAEPRTSNLPRRVIASFTARFKREVMAAWREVMANG